MVKIDDILKVLSEIDDKVILLIFSAKWCGPCKRLKAKLKDSSDSKVELIKDLKYIIIDVDDDENDEICSQFGIGNIPHQFFVCLKDNTINIKKHFKGYDLDQLILYYQQIIEELSYNNI